MLINLSCRVVRQARQVERVAAHLSGGVDQSFQVFIRCIARHLTARAEDETTLLPAFEQAALHLSAHLRWRTGQHHARRVNVALDAHFAPQDRFGLRQVDQRIQVDDVRLQFCHRHDI